MSVDNEKKYAVGYGKPPRHGQFKRGRSGNPKGRPKGTKNLKTDLLEELSEKIAIQEGDRSTRVSKQRALIKTQVARALKGSDQAASKILDLYLRILGLDEAAVDAGMPLSADEEAVLANLEARILHRVNKSEDGGEAI